MVLASCAVRHAIGIEDVRPDPIAVVAVDQVLLDVGHTRVDRLAQVAQPSVEGRGHDPVTLADEALGADEAHVVIHHNIELVALALRSQGVDPLAHPISSIRTAHDPL